MLEFKFVF